MIKVLLADDHQLVIDGLKALLSQQTDITIIGQVKNGQEVMEFLLKKKPDLILLDVNMPVLNGIQTTTLLREQYPDVKILILTMYKNKTIINGLIRLGAHGCILKNTGNNELNQAIRTVAAGGTFFSNEIAMMLAEQPEVEEDKESVILTEREIDIIRQLANGLTTKEIGAKLFLSPYTVETHRKNINSKLGLSNVAEVIRYALESGIL